jgi:DNA-directed RNA polymerase specialized sigma24 family protein
MRAPILRRVRTGEPFAIRDVLSRQLFKLWRWANDWLPNWAVDPDATSDSARETLQAYLRSSVLDRIRQKRTSESRGGSARREDADVADAGEPASPEALIGVEGARRYDAALGRMPAEEREAVVARLELGYNYEQIALILGLSSADAARSAVARSLGHLATEMDREP